MKMKHPQDLWREYREAVYPGKNPLPAQQNLECHQAFFAGMLSYMTESDKVASMTDEEAMKEFQPFS
jgi:hypothetical protein